jgi:hypothetical protein
MEVPLASSILDMGIVYVFEVPFEESMTSFRYNVCEVRVFALLQYIFSNDSSCIP